MRTVALLGWLIAAGSSSVVHAEVLFNDGGVHVVDTRIDDFIQVRNAAGGAVTTVTFESGAFITGTDRFDDTVFVQGDSVINVIDGRFVNDVSAYQRGELNIEGGQFDDDVFATNQAIVRLSGGVIEDDLEAFGNSRIVMTGGSIGEDIEADGGTIVISGGTFATGGIVDLDTGLGVSRGGSIQLIGSNFRLNGSAIGFGELTAETGLLSGVLADGSAFNDIPFTRIMRGNGSPGSLTLSAIPEPSHCAVLALGGLIVVGRRRWQSQRARASART